jgi:hypothetical protein
VLTSLDDFPIHQTSRPVAHVTGGPNHYDRYFFNGYTADGSIFFAVALGLYPNRLVIDGAFSVVRAGEQVNVYASGRCPDDRSRTRIGPLRVEVLRPMEELRVTLDATEHGVSADLVFRARTRAVEEPHFSLHDGIRTVFDYTRFTQFGTWEGWVAVDGARIECDPAEVLGSRDRSWGVRPVGERAPGPPLLTQLYWLWAPVNFPDRCTHFDVQEHADGRRWHESGVVVPVGTEPAEVATSVDYRAGWVPGTRFVEWFEADFHRPDGSVDRLRLEPILHFQMAGLGYLNHDWRHGEWKGELAVGADRWVLPVPDPLAFDRLHIQALCRATFGGAEGVGVLEQLVLGPHAPTGLREWSDGAPGVR